MMLYKLLSAMDRKTFDSEVISLTDIGSVGKKIEALGVPVRVLGMRRGLPNPLMILKLAGWLRRFKPDAIQTWMYHADLIGGLAAKIAGGIPVAWGIRQSNLDPTGSKRTTIWTAKLCAWLSHCLPSKIVCCSNASQQVHHALGYAVDKMIVIPNGFDLTAFKPDPAARSAVREQLGIAEQCILIGLVGRFDPQKNHHNFILAAVELLKRRPEIHFVLCGDQVDWKNTTLSNWIDQAGVRSNFHLLGRRQDIPHLTAALDIASSSSSYGEGFPNVVGEAMACGVPCVVTDVGDSALIVGETSRVVLPRDPFALATAWLELIDLGSNERKQLGEAARQRIHECFSLPDIAEQYGKLYQQVVVKCAE